MRIVSFIIVVAFLFLVLHVSVEHVGAVSSDLEAVHHAYHGDRDTGGKQTYCEPFDRKPWHHDAYGHHHDATLLQLKAKPSVHNLSSTFFSMSSLPRDVEQKTFWRGGPSAPPRHFSLCLSKQSFLL